MRSETPSSFRLLGGAASAKPVRVLVIGDVMIDIIVKPEGPIERGTEHTGDDSAVARGIGRKPGGLAGQPRQ